MLHTNVAELRLLVDTFTRVWSSGGQANLSLQTKDSQMWAKLDLQLGPAGGTRPGPPEAGESARGEHRNFQAQPDCPLHPLPRQPTVRRKGPAARARDTRRRQEWLEKRQETAVELPTAQADLEQDPQADSVPEQEEQETVLAMATNNMLGEGTSKSNNDSDTIPQLDGQVETKSNDLPPEKTHVEKEDEAVIFQMLNNGFAETKTIAPGVNPPAIVIHPELGIGKNPVKTHWHDSFWFEYVFEPSGVQMEMYQVQVESTDDGSRA